MSQRPSEIYLSLKTALEQVARGETWIEEKRMKENDFVKLVKEMREMQKRYFKTRSMDALSESKRLEREVDKYIEETEKGVSLFDRLDGKDESE